MNIARRLSSSALSKRVGGSTRPSICWRGNSSVASQESSDLPKKRRKVVPLEERKAMVKCYVSKYRAMNSGKFPTYHEALKQVGGSYYIIRKLIQELQYQAKISTTSTVETYTQGEVIKDGKTLSGTNQISTSNMTTYKNIHRDGETRDDNVSSKEAATLSSFQLPFVATVQEEPIQGNNQASPETESAKNDESEHEVEETRFFQPESNVNIAENSCESAASNVGSVLHKTKNDESLHDAEEIRFYQSDVKVAENSCKSAASNGDTTQLVNVIDDKLKVEAADSQQYSNKVEDNTKMQDSPKLDKLEPEPYKLHQAQKLGTVTRDLSKHHADDTAVEKKSNMWNNMKSFADGIFSFFRKQ